MATFAHLSIVFTGYTPDRVVVTNTSGQQQEVCCTCTVLYCTVLCCTVQVWDTSVFTSTLVTEFQLVGERAVLLPTLTFTYMLAVALANLAAGQPGSTCSN